VSFGASATTKKAENNLGGITDTLTNLQAPKLTGMGDALMGQGQGTVQPAVNLFNTLLAGNRANTTAALQPSIDQIREGSTNSLNAISTLTPRGGGRYGSLFAHSMAPQGQIQNLFNTARTTAAQTLPQIGLQEMGMGTNLFGLANSALGTAGNLNSSLAEIGQRQQQMKNAMWGGLGKGLFSLATTPFGGGSEVNGLLGLIGG
jgi:hypothetical protein